MNEKKKRGVDLASLQFEEDVVKDARGFQKSVWDAFKDKFPEEGSCLRFPLDVDGGLTRQQASQITKRMMILHPGIYFHSYVDTVSGKVVVRRRENDWTPSKSEEDGEENN